MTRPLKPPFDYERDPQAIYARSFATIRAEADLTGLPADVAGVAVRLIHACGMTDIVRDLAYADDVVGAARAALAEGAPILVDARMVAAGIIRERLSFGNEVRVLLAHPDTAEAARAERTTRSAAAVTLAGAALDGAIVVIGNAPTALFRLLELVGEGRVRPAAILGFPVGFVGAFESKDALIRASGGIPYLTLRGRRGGSAIAAAAVNAIAGAGP